jgi:hypothetical protein
MDVLLLHCVKKNFPTPKVISAKFLPNASFVVISFDSPTNKGYYHSYFPCNSLFSFASVNTAKCQWLNFVDIALHSQAPIVDVEMIISIKVPNSVTAFCSSNSSNICKSLPTVCNQSFIVTAPQDLESPSVSISAPDVLSWCDPLTIDLTASIGSGGRSWKSIYFEVSVYHGSDTKSLQTFLNSNYSFSPPSSIPHTFLSSDNT